MENDDLFGGAKRWAGIIGRLCEVLILNKLITVEQARYIAIGNEEEKEVEDGEDG